MPELKEKKINFSIEYDGDKQRAAAFVTYPGEPLDPLELNKNISLAIVKNIAESIQHSYRENEYFSNELVINVK